jgi:hypothetical protein
MEQPYLDLADHMVAPSSNLCKSYASREIAIHPEKRRSEDSD